MSPSGSYPEDDDVSNASTHQSRLVDYTTTPAVLDEPCSNHISSTRRKGSPKKSQIDLVCSRKRRLRVKPKDSANSQPGQEEEEEDELDENGQVVISFYMRRYSLVRHRYDAMDDSDNDDDSEWVEVDDEDDDDELGNLKWRADRMTKNQMMNLTTLRRN